MKIKNLRAITGLSQAKFAKKFGIPKRTIENWEEGKAEPAQYIPKMIEEIIRNEQKLEGQINIEYHQLSDDDIIMDEIKEDIREKNYTHKERIISDIWAYLDEDANLCCKDCKYKDDEEGCDQATSCCIQNYIYYDEMIELLGIAAKKGNEQS